MKVAFMKIYKYRNEISGEKNKKKRRINVKQRTHRYLLSFISDVLARL
jgi:hypothetical protein